MERREVDSRPDASPSLPPGSVAKEHTQAAEITPDQSPATFDRCRLVDCTSPSPTHADPPDSPRLEFSEFQRRAKLLADEFLCGKDVPGMVSSVLDLDCAPFHDELVTLLLRHSLEHKEPERDSVIALLGALHSEHLLSPAQLV